MASRLQVGDRIRTTTGITIIEEIRVATGYVKVYNFTVQDNHTYYVSEAEVLVHNYVVKGGDSLSKIAAAMSRKTGQKITVEDLMKANNIKSRDQIKVGQKLTIPGGGEFNVTQAFYDSAIIAASAQEAYLQGLGNFVKCWHVIYCSSASVRHDSDFFQKAKGKIKPYSEVMYQFKNSGKGWSNNSGQANPEDHKYARLETVKTLKETIESWHNDNPKIPLHVNDLSTKGGGDSPFGHHFSGVSIDVKWVASDGKAYGGNYNAKNNSEHYDEQKTIDLIQTFIDSTPKGYETQAIFFNDPKVIAHFKNTKNSYGQKIVRKLGGHSDHIHVQVKKSKKKSKK